MAPIAETPGVLLADKQVYFWQHSAALSHSTKYFSHQALCQKRRKENEVQLHVSSSAGWWPCSLSCCCLLCLLRLLVLHKVGCEHHSCCEASFQMTQVC